MKKNDPDLLEFFDKLHEKLVELNSLIYTFFLYDDWFDNSDMLPKDDFIKKGEDFK